MDSPTTKTQKTPSNVLDSTLELPVSKVSTRKNIDVYLPNISKSWRGPALQESDFHEPLIATLNDDLDDSIPQAGMFRAIDPTLGQPMANVTPNYATEGVSNYARRSTKRARVYTVLFLLLLIAAATWMYLNLESYLAAFLSDLQ